MTEQMGRLAMRVEGDWWNAYYALPDTMEGALLLGSIRMRFVEDRDRKNAFIAMMREAAGDIMEETFGERPDWGGEQRAPEHERSGSA